VWWDEVSDLSAFIMPVGDAHLCKTWNPSWPSRITRSTEWRDLKREMTCWDRKLFAFTQWSLHWKMTTTHGRTFCLCLPCFQLFYFNEGENEGDTNGEDREEWRQSQQRTATTIIYYCSYCTVVVVLICGWS
jgi:hypothetical protein